MKHGTALIGLGLAVEPHARSLAELSDQVDVRWAMSRSPGRCAAFARRHPWPTTTALDGVLSDPEVQSVLILTPPPSHLELARKAAAAGKHVLVEKPLALTSGDALALCETVDGAGLRLGVVLQHRFRASTLKLEQALTSGALGRVEAASVTIPWWRPQSYYDEPGRGTLARDGGGVLMTQAIHTLDVFRALTGPVRSVCGLAATTGLHRMETEDFAGAIMELAGGGVATLVATTAAFPGGHEEIRLMCRNGTALLQGNALAIEWLDGRRETIAGDAGTGGGADPMAFSHGPHRALIRDFIEACEKGRSPKVSGADAVATQLLIDAILESARRRAWVSVPSA